MAFAQTAFQNDAFQIADLASSVVTGGLPPNAMASHGVPTAQASAAVPSATASHALPVSEATHPRPRS